MTSHVSVLPSVHAGAASHVSSHLLPCVRSLDDRNRPPLLPGSRSLLSASPHVYLLPRQQHNIRFGTTHGKRRYASDRSVVFILTCVVGQRPAVAVKDEPALLPRLDLSSHLDEEAAARLLRNGDVVAGIDVVSGRLDVTSQVEVVLPHRQVASQRTRL